jgi:hypothetical protein
MCDRTHSQEVGLEAATLERVRNSSLVEWSRADNVPGLKPGAEAADPMSYGHRMVGERCLGDEVDGEPSVERRQVRMSA